MTRKAGQAVPVSDAIAKDNSQARPPALANQARGAR